MFLDNVYKRIYYSIIERAKNRKSIQGYSETHHIIPRSLGGNDDDFNLVTLTAREHCICHLLLIRMTDGEHKEKMLYAAKMMTTTSRYYQSRYKTKSKTYEWLRQKAAKLSSSRLKGKTYEELYGTEKAKELRIKKSLPRGPQKQETIAKRVEKLRGKKRTEEQRTKMSVVQKENAKNRVYSPDKISIFVERVRNSISKPKSKEHREKISNSLKGKMLGISKNAETIEKMKKPKSEAHRKAISEARKGKTFKKP